MKDYSYVTQLDYENVAGPDWPKFEQFQLNQSVPEWVYNEIDQMLGPPQVFSHPSFCVLPFYGWEYPINQACLPSIISPKSGLNICAIGTPENYNLNNILPTYITLLRKDYIEDGYSTDQSTAIIKNSFNYLSLVSPHSNLAVSYIIEDYLS